ncbi:MAG: hypothetical protein DMD25_06930, partial [Gemmatimonadetes bacterium]
MLAARCRDASLHLLLSLLERVQLDAGRLTGAIQFVLPLPRAVERVGEVAHLAGQRLGVGAQRLEPAGRLDRRLHALHRRKLAAQGVHRLGDVAEPGFRAALRLEHPADLVVGHPHALQRILDRRVSSLETREVVQRCVDGRLRLLESRQALGHLLDRLRESLGIGSHGTEALALGFELRDGIG